MAGCVNVLRCLVLGLLLLLQACATSYDGAGLVAGARGDEVRAVMGEPAAIYPDPQGGSIWAYPRGPAGLHTYMVSFNAAGAMTGIDQVLDDLGFARLRPGVHREADVLRLFGPFWMDVTFALSKERVLTWRFRDAWGGPAQFHVVLDSSGTVLRWFQLAEDNRPRRWDPP